MWLDLGLLVPGRDRPRAAAGGAAVSPREIDEIEVHRRSFAL
jgi:hypothetical protein